MKKKVLITGGTGFIGANLARRLVREGHNVHLVVKSDHQKWRVRDLSGLVQLHPVDLVDQSRVEKAVKKIKPHWIFHLAAHGAYPTQTAPSQIFQTNILGTLHLVEACLKAGFESFVNVGSSSEYGYKDHAPSETEWLDPNSHYAVSKACATMLCRYFSIDKKVSIVTLRPYSVYGPYEEPSRLFPTLIIKGMAGQYPSLVNPKIARDFIYVDDFVEACLLAAGKKHEFGAVYNVGTGRQTTIEEVVAIARKVFQITRKPQWGTMKSRIWDTKIWVSDSRKIRKVLGWQAQTSIQEGFLKMLGWFYAQPGMIDFYKKTIS